MILTINLAAAAFLAGLTLYSQIIHYPLFTYIDKKSFIEYYIYHLKRNTFTVFIPMLIEGAFSIIFAFNYPEAVPGAIPFLCLCLSTSMWIVTFSNVVPLQDKLSDDGFDKDTIEKLVQINWVRTLGWFVKVLLLLYCMSKVIFIM